MKKITAVILAALAAALTISAGSYTLGDTDENGIIDGRDATLVLTEYAQTSTGKKETFSDLQNKAADVDENNIIDGRDASWILSYYAYISANGGEMDLRRFVKGEENDFSVKYDNSLENITKSADVFNSISEQMAKEIMDFRLETIGYEGNSYAMTGIEESKVTLFLINEEYNFDPDVLTTVFDGYTESDLRNGALLLLQMGVISEKGGANTDFNKYSLNPTVGYYLNELLNSGKQAIVTGDATYFDDVVNELSNLDDQNIQNNFAIGLMMTGMGREIPQSEYYNYFSGDIITKKPLCSDITKERVLRR